MRVGIDIQAARGKTTGLGVYTAGLFGALKEILPPDIKLTGYEREDDKSLNTPARLAWENWGLPLRARKDKLDLLHIPAFAPPVFKFTRFVVTVHDLIGIAFPNQMNWPSRLYWQRWLPMAVRGADRVIADSEWTKKDIVKYLGLAPEKVRVIYASGHEGFSPVRDPELLEALKQRIGIRERYFIFVGTIEPRKNLGRVIEALRIFLARRRALRHQLVIVGSKEFARGEAFQKIVDLPGLKSDDVLFTGYLEFEELKALYTGARSLVFPSLYEGFGIPLLEAMACEIPVLSARATSLPEVGGDAAYYVDPLDTEAIARGMEALSEDETLRVDLIGKGKSQIQKFSWRRTARETLEVYGSLF